VLTTAVNVTSLVSVVAHVPWEGDVVTVRVASGKPGTMP